MATPHRLGGGFAAILLVSGIASGQLPTAPPPHPALHEVVKEYERLGLPLPLRNVQLVRVQQHRIRLPLGAELIGIDRRSDRYRQLLFGVDKEPYRLAYRVPPAKPGDQARYLTVGWLGVGLRELENVEPDSVEETRPAPDAVRWVARQSGSYLLAFAVQCKALGWDDLSAALYARAREQFAEEKSGRPVPAELREIVWRFWALGLTESGTDRSGILRRLTALWEEEPALRTRYNEWLLRSLASTVAPRKSKPGTAEALIDDLTEYRADTWSELGRGRVPPDGSSYWKLAELGFDAVPALIEHLGDDRLTREWDPGFNNFPARLVLVGDVCSRMLSHLSAGEIVGSHGEFLGHRIDPAEARKWFEQAKKVGEEKWLLAHALPADGPPIVRRKGCPEPLILRVIGAKYPDQLAAIYRAKLRRPIEECWDADYVPEVVASKLPREQKIALFEEGAANTGRFHRVFALEGLARIDPVALRKPLLATLERIRPPTWLWQPEPVSEYSLVPLTEAAGDRACWDALAVAGKARGVTFRLNLIDLVSKNRPVGREDPHRSDRIRFLVQFLDDQTPEVCAAWDGVQVRDHAAGWLAVLLGFWAEGPKRCQWPGETRGTLSRLFIRAVVWQAADKELVAGR